MAASRGGKWRNYYAVFRQFTSEQLILLPVGGGGGRQRRSRKIPLPNRAPPCDSQLNRPAQCPSSGSLVVSVSLDRRAAKGDFVRPIDTCSRRPRRLSSRWNRRGTVQSRSMTVRVLERRLTSVVLNEGESLVSMVTNLSVRLSS